MYFWRIYATSKRNLVFRCYYVQSLSVLDGANASRPRKPPQTNEKPGTAITGLALHQSVVE